MAHCERDEYMAQRDANAKAGAEVLRLKNQLANMVTKTELSAARDESSLLKASAESLSKTMREDMVSRVLLKDALNAAVRHEDSYQKLAASNRALKQETEVMRRKLAQSVDKRLLDASNEVS